MINPGSFSWTPRFSFRFTICFWVIWMLSTESRFSFIPLYISLFFFILWNIHTCILVTYPPPYSFYPTHRSFLNKLLLPKHAFSFHSNTLSSISVACIWMNRKWCTLKWSICLWPPPSLRNSEWLSIQRHQVPTASQLGVCWFLTKISILQFYQ